MNLIKNGTCQNDFCASETNVGLLPHEELPYQWTTDYISPSSVSSICYSSEVSPQISVVTFARTKIILARAIFDEIHGVRSNFLHVLPVELRTAGYIAVCQTLSSLSCVAGKGSGC